LAFILLAASFKYFSLAILARWGKQHWYKNLRFRHASTTTSERSICDCQKT
jgi:hypothetical protein